MAASSSTLSILIEIKNAITGAREIRGVGEASEQAGKQAEATGERWKGMGKRLLGAVGGALAIKKGFDFLKGAAGDALALAKSTATLTRVTGLDAQASSAWVSMTKSRGIETKSLQVAFTAYSKQIRALTTNNKGAIQAFAEMGISQKDVLGTYGDFQKQLELAADAMARLPPGADKAALSVKLFGRSGQILLPLLNEGAAGVRNQMKAVQEAGLTMDQEGVENTMKLAKSQRLLNTQMQGVKLTIGQALIPVLLSIAEKILPVAQWFSTLIQRSPILKTVIIALAAGLGVATIAMWALNSAFLANPITWIILGVVAAVILLIKFWPQLKAAALAAWNWIKEAANNAWEFLKRMGASIAAPFVTAWNWIRNAASNAFNAVKGAITSAKNWVQARVSDVVGFVTSIPGRIAGGALALFQPIKTGISSAWNWVRNRIEAVVGFVKSIPGRIAGGALALFQPIKEAITSAWHWVRQKVEDIVGFVKGIPGRIGGGVTSVLSHIPGIGGFFGAAGGVVPRSSPVLVGERGPELLQLPGGARITPIKVQMTLAQPSPRMAPMEQHITLVQPRMTPPEQHITLAQPRMTPVEQPAVEPLTLAGAGARGETHIHLDVDGRELTHVVANVVDEQELRG